MSAVTHASERAKVDSATPEQTQQYLLFTLGSEAFAIGILAIKEIIEYDALTTVPMMSPCIRGVINLRGAVVPVMDLAIRFDKPASPVTKRTCIVIIERHCNGEREDVGVIVDAVNAVLEIPFDEIEPAPTFGAKIRNDFLLGLGKVNGKFIILLDAARVLAVEEEEYAPDGVEQRLGATSAPGAEVHA